MSYPKLLRVEFSKNDVAELTQLGPDTFCCPVCGFDGVERPYAGNGSSSFEICAICRVQYGFDDCVDEDEAARGVTHEYKWAEYRKRWLESIVVDSEVRARFRNIGIEV